MAIRDRITQFVTYLVKQIKCSQGGILIGRVTGEGKAQEITVGSGLSFSGTTLTATGSQPGHTHDDRYYTEGEVDGLLGGKADAETTLGGYGITDAAPVLIRSAAQGRPTGTVYQVDRIQMAGFGTLSIPPFNQFSVSWNGQAAIEFSMASLAQAGGNTLTLSLAHQMDAIPEISAVWTVEADGTEIVMTRNAQGHLSGFTFYSDPGNAMYHSGVTETQGVVGTAAVCVGQLSRTGDAAPYLWDIWNGTAWEPIHLPNTTLTASKSVANAAARLALSLENAQGFAVVDADTGKTWMLVEGGTPSVSSDWLQLGDRDITAADITDPQNLVTNARVVSAIGGDPGDVRSAFEFSPLELSPVAWWDGTDSAHVLKTISGSVVAAAGETVERWTDKIGGLNLDQTTSGQRRTLASDGSLIPNDTGGASLTGSIPISHASMSLVIIHGKRTTTKQQPGYLWLNAGFTSGALVDRMGGNLYGPTSSSQSLGAYDDSGSLLALCYGASSSTIYNHYKTVSAAARTAGAQTITRLFDYDANAVPHRLPIRHILLFDRQLTAAEITLLRTWAAMPEKEVVVSTLGDSIINGASPNTMAQSFLRQLAQAKGWTIANGAVDGTVLTSIIASAAADLNRAYTSGKTNRLILHVGTNDMAANADPATFLTNLATFYAARKAHAADWDVAVCTLPPRNNSFSGGQDAAGYAADRATINAALQAAAPGTYFDRLIDFESDAILGPDATADSTTWFNADKIHPNTNGHNRMAVIAAAVYP